LGGFDVNKPRFAHGADELRAPHFLRVPLRAVLQVNLPHNLILPVFAERVGDVLRQTRLGLEVSELVHELAELVVPDASVAGDVCVDERLVQHLGGFLRREAVQDAEVGQNANQLAFVDRAAVVLVVMREEIHHGIRTLPTCFELLSSTFPVRRVGRDLLVPLGKVFFVDLVQVLLVHLDFPVKPVQGHVEHLRLLAQVNVRAGLLELHFLQELNGLRHQGFTFRGIRA
jgi:hypothetical protein